MREIYFYRASTGRSPVQEFLDSLSGKQVQKILWVLGVIQQLERVPAEYLKKLPGTEEIWEVRAEHSGSSFRLLGFFDGARLVVLTNGFAKKTDKTPRREIALAEQRRRDYLHRKHEHD